MNLKSLVLSSFLGINSLFSNTLDNITRSEENQQVKISKLNTYLNSKQKKLATNEYWKVFKTLYSNSHPITYSFPSEINNELLESSLNYLSNFSEEKKKTVLSNLMKHKTIGELENAAESKNPALAAFNQDLDPNYDLGLVIAHVNKSMLERLPDLYKKSIYSTLKTISYYICYEYNEKNNQHQDINGLNKKNEIMYSTIQSDLHKQAMKDIFKKISRGFYALKQFHPKTYQKIKTTSIDDFKKYNDRIEKISKKAKEILKFTKRLKNRQGIGFSNKANRKLRNFKSFYQGKQYEDILRDNKNSLIKILESSKPEEISLISYIDIMARQPLYTLSIFENLNRDFEVIKILDRKRKFEQHYNLEYRGYEKFFSLEDKKSFTLNSKVELLAFNFGKELIESKIYQHCNQKEISRLIGKDGISSSEEMIDGLHLLMNEMYKSSNDKNFLHGLLRVLILPIKNLGNDLKQLSKTPRIFKREGFKEGLMHVVEYGVRTGIDIYLLERFNAKSIAKNYSIHFALDNNKITKKAYRNAFVNTAMQAIYFLPQEQTFSIQNMINDTEKLLITKDKAIRIEKGSKLFKEIAYIQKVIKYNIYTNILDFENIGTDLKRAKSGLEKYVK